jgi:phage-related protein
MASDNDKKIEQQINNLLSERKKLDQEILGLKAQMQSEEKKSVANIEQMIKLESLRLNNVEKEEAVRKRISDIQSETLETTTSINTEQKTTNDGVKYSYDLSSKLNTLKGNILYRTERIKEETHETKVLNAAVNENSKKQLGFISNIETVYGGIAEKMKVGSESAFASSEQTAKYTGILEKAAETTQDMVGYEQQIVEAKAKGESVDLSPLLKAIDLTKARVQIAYDEGKITSSQYDELMSGENSLVGMMQNRVKVLEQSNKQLEKQAAQTGIVKDAFGELNLNAAGLVSKLPAGDKINKIMNIKGNSDDMNKRFTEAIKSGLEGNFKKAFTSGAAGLGSMVKIAAKLPLAIGIGGLVGGIGMLVKGFTALDQQIADMGKQFSMSYEGAAKLYKNTNRMATEMKITGINSKEIAEGIEAASEAMGGIDIAAQINAGNKEAENFAKQTTVLTKQFGLSADEVGKIKDLSVMTGKSMDDLVKETVKLGGSTFSAKQTMKTLAAIPPQVTVAFKGSTKELIAAAQKAKMLGMELSQVQQIGRGMLDIDQSLASEMEARVITGKDLNLDAARQYALNGDIYNLQEELLNQAGSLKDFQKMNALQQESMAKAMGMSVEDMTKMLTNAEKMKNMNIDADYAKRLDDMETAADLEKEAGKARSKEQKDYIMQLAAEKRSASIKEKMADILEKIKAKMAPIVEKIMTMVHGLFDGAKGASSFEKIIDGIDVDAIVAGLKDALPKIMEAVKKLIQNLPDIIKFVTKIVDKFAGIASGGAGLLSFINPSVAGFGAMALKVAGPGGIAAGFKLAGTGAMGLFGVVKGPLTEGIGKLAGGITGKLGGAFGKVGEKASGMLGKAGGMLSKIKTPGKLGDDGAGALLDKQKDTLGKADKMGDKASSMGKKIADFGKGLGSALKSVGKGIGSAFEGILTGLGKGLEALGRSLSTPVVPMGTVAIAVGLFFLALGASLYMAAPAIKAIAPVLMRFAEIIGKVLVKALEVAGPIIQKIIETVGKVLIAFMPVLMKVAEVLGGVFIAAIQQIAPIIKSVFEGIATVINSIGDQIVKVIDSIGNNIVKVVDKLLSVANLDPGKLVAIAAGIGVLGGALLAFGGGSGIGSIAEGLGSLVGGDSPIDQLLKIMDKVDPKTIGAVVAGIAGIGTAMKVMADNLGNIDGSKLEEFGNSLSGLMKGIGGGALMEGVGKMLGGESPLAQVQKLITSLDPQKLSAVSKSLIEVSNSLKTLAETISKMDVDKLTQVMDKVGGTGMGSSITKAVGSIMGGITSLFGGGGESKPKAQAVSPVAVTATSTASMSGQTTSSPASKTMGGSAPAKDNSNVVAEKLDKLISILGAMSTQPTVIKIGDRTVEELKTQIDFKKAYNIGVDNSYGRKL